jgi:hypothetical protein
MIKINAIAVNYIYPGQIVVKTKGYNSKVWGVKNNKLNKKQIIGTAITDAEKGGIVTILVRT